MTSKIVFPSSLLPYVCKCEQLPESSIGKALRLLHERLSSKITSVATDGVLTSKVQTVPSESLLENGLHSSPVGLGCDGLGLRGPVINGVESGGILVNSSI